MGYYRQFNQVIQLEINIHSRKLRWKDGAKTYVKMFQDHCGNKMFFLMCIEAQAPLIISFFIAVIFLRQFQM